MPSAHRQLLPIAHRPSPIAGVRFPDAFIGIPFVPDGRDRSGCDCWGLIWMVYRDILGITIHDYTGLVAGNSVADLMRRAKLMDAERAKWEMRSRYEIPQPFDVVLLRTKGVPSHVGLVVDNRRMLHVTEGIDSCIEDYTGPLWRDRVIGIYYRSEQ